MADTAASTATEHMTSASDRRGEREGKWACEVGREGRGGGGGVP